MKIETEKVRAENNRTLILSESDKQRLAEHLFIFDQKKNIKKEDVINKTILGDTLEIIDYIPKGIADLIIIDPPYNLSKDFHGIKFCAQENDEYINYLRLWFSKVVSILKPSGSLYVCGDWRSTAALYQVMSENLFVKNRITWQREKGRGAQSNWKNGMEDIWFGVKNSKNYYFDAESVKMRRQVVAPYRKDGEPKDWEETKNGKFRMTFPSNFWDDISIPYWSMPENTDHPTQKPEKLIAKLVLASCPSGGIVFDPFLGSGTTSVVAKKLNRKYIGIELNKEYALWAEKRLEKALSDKSIQGYVDGMFWERNTLHLQKSLKNKKIDH